VVVEDHPDFDLLDLEPVNPGLESFPQTFFLVNPDESTAVQLIPSPQS